MTTQSREDGLSGFVELFLSKILPQDTMHVVTELGIGEQSTFVE